MEKGRLSVTSMELEEADVLVVAQGKVGSLR